MRIVWLMRPLWSSPRALCSLGCSNRKIIIQVSAGCRIFLASLDFGKNENCKQILRTSCYSKFIQDLLDWLYLNNGENHVVRQLRETLFTNQAPYCQHFQDYTTHRLLFLKSVVKASDVCHSWKLIRKYFWMHLCTPCVVKQQNKLDCWDI